MKTPVFVSVDPAAILKEVVSSYESLSGTTCQPGQPEYLMCSCLAYHKILVLNRINEAGKSQLLDLSTAPVTDYLASLLGVSRLPASKALCSCAFTFVEGHLQVVIPLGTRVASSDSEMVFETTDDVIIPVGINSINITMQCQTAGTAGNGYSAGSINVLQDPYAFISTVTNLEMTYGGSDEETDTELIDRVKLAPSRFSVAGSRNAYIFWTKTASSAIIDVSVMTYSQDETIPPGQVRIYLLVENTADQTAINGAVAEVLNAEKIRPLTDTVLVLSPSIVEYSVEISITKTKDGDNTITNKINTAIWDYVDAKSRVLGLDIVSSKLEALSMIDGVYDADATIVSDGTIQNGNLIIKDNEVSKCTGIAINISGTNE